MLDQVRGERAGDTGYVDFCVAGTPGAGEYHCADCGYGVTVQVTLPQCPMCAGTTWEPHASSPFTRAAIRHA
jgi:rubredoxin